MKSGRLLPKFQRKGWEVKQRAPEYTVQEAMEMKQWRSEELSEYRNVEYLTRKATGLKMIQFERISIDCNLQSHILGDREAHCNAYLITMCPGARCSYRT